jgi:Reverse transcriptase (RNA-dependent DNA polymerase)
VKLSHLSFRVESRREGQKVVDARLSEHIAKHSLLPVHQSAYRPHHSTETAVVCIMNDMINATDKGNDGAIMLLAMSAAFDNVDHSIMLDVLKRRFGIQQA